MIVCQICSQTFKSMITIQHLKKHNIDIPKYKEIYGNNSIVSNEYRNLRKQQTSGQNNPNFGNKWTLKQKQKQAANMQGKMPWNKGKQLSDNTKRKISTLAKKRNTLWRENNNHPLSGRKHSKETIDKIKKSRQYQIISPDSITKAINTKIKNGYDLSFFKGHKHTKQTKMLLSEKSKERAKQKHLQSIEVAKQNLLKQHIEIENAIGPFLEVFCQRCQTRFTFSKQLAYSEKLKNNICPLCYPPNAGSSSAKRNIATWLKQQGVEIIQNTRNIINPFELDIYLPTQKVAIEYCGLYWHSELHGKGQQYHLSKLKKCESLGIRLITIFEDEWINTPQIVKSRLMQILHLTTKKLMARKCLVREINSKVANSFLKQNHLQGVGRSNYRLGAYINNELVSIMTFTHLNKKSSIWEIDRFCSLINTSIPGISSKLFKHFIQHVNPVKVISFADRRWSNNLSVYQTLEFKLDSHTAPLYWYFLPLATKRYHRYSLRKNKSDNQNLTEWENRQEQGFDRIWDCGYLKWIWTIK